MGYDPARASRSAGRHRVVRRSRHARAIPCRDQDRSGSGALAFREVCHQRSPPHPGGLGLQHPADDRSGNLAGTRRPAAPPAKRRRMKTVIQEIITLAVRLKRHARQWILAFPTDTAAFAAFTRLTPPGQRPEPPLSASLYPECHRSAGASLPAPRKTLLSEPKNTPRHSNSPPWPGHRSAIPHLLIHKISSQASPSEGTHGSRVNVKETARQAHDSLVGSDHFSKAGRSYAGSDRNPNLISFLIQREALRCTLSAS